MEPTKETAVQERPRHEVLSEKLTPFKEKLGTRVVELMTADRTKEKDYKIEVVDNQYHPGIIHTTETWDGGSRSTRKIDKRYQTRDAWDDKPGDFYMGTVVDKGYREVGVGMDLKADGSLTQEIHCTTETASRATYGTEPLMKGEFFRWAGQGNMTENVRVSPDGQVSRSRHWSEDKWLGRNDRYQTHVVTEDNGIVRSGRGEHGIMLGYQPEMEVVSSPTQK